MGTKRKYHAYQADSSDDQDQNFAHSRMVWLTADRRRQLTMPISQMKLQPTGMQNDEPTAFFADDLEPTLDIEAGWSEDERGEHDSQEIINKPSTKRYTNSDAPLREWMGYDGCVGYREEFLLEDQRLEGRGGAGLLCSCKRLDENNHPIPSLFRCEECFGRDIVCQECCLDHHKRLPLHVIKKWNGQYFERTSLKDIGLRVQLGHLDMTCPCPVRGHIEFIVLHVNGIHHLMRCDWFPSTVHQPQTACTRRLLEHFLLLMWSSKVSAFEFYQTLERLTDNTGVSVPKSRYTAFMRMVREYRHILLLKRGGRGHVENGIANVRQGELAVHCPACPHPGINLPRGWETVEPSLKFLYYSIIAMDANFRLKNRTRSSDLADPGMHTGLAYFVVTKPYSAHVLQFASQKDVSTCSGFSALAHAESKFSNGLRATGVGLCICAHHEFVRPKGVGDLQKGERFCNMDFIFFSTIIPLLLLNVVISYDIACQWKINLLDRMTKLPEKMHIPVAVTTTSFMFGIPKFHASAHDDGCSIPHSLNLMPGVGRTDGEGVERNWSEMNRVANSTKEMGPGARHDTLDDHFGHHNWRKFVGLGLSLRKRLLIAVKERDRQQAAFQEFNLTVSTSYENQWTAMVESWEADKTQPNPFTNKERGVSEADVCAHFAEQDKAAATAGRFHHHNMSLSVFIAWGLSLEDSQRRLRFEIINGTLSSYQQAELQQRRTSLLKQIHRFRSVQAIYMVDLEILLEQDDDGSLVEAENTILLLPSSISAVIRTSTCRDDITCIEEKLRNTQCHDCLHKLRNALRARVHLIKHRNRETRGQRANTRAASIISRLDGKIKMLAGKYRTAHECLIALRGRGSWEGELRPLNAHDVQGPSEDVGSLENPSDIIGSNGCKQTKKQLAAASRRLGQGFMQVSWIWTSVGMLGDDDNAGLNDALRVEWAKACARALRWNEEVLLLKEEMRRTRTFLEWKARWWENRAKFAVDDRLLSEGIAAYAFRQAALQHRLSISFLQLWSTSLTTQDHTSQPSVDEDEDVVIHDEAYDDAEDDLED
ncbi:hypothetical protein DEU56DRAFT_916197 [Suillus clintonianus]|uniref:uncharacterized protein n=1 Tax=Suillus clintonianus TaxID=1904413 RepID=UPI001B864637|nr:uncharacterized protein DEU56DRAFT_916197 [Suillus clintonianus]KAG2126046.1 hypothetical protein DEU56DRAFT_916197 [Suillus clintonianus]